MATSILKVWGIGTKTADTLSDHGYNSAEDLAAATEEELGKVAGFGPARASRVINMAQSLVHALPDSPEVTADLQVKGKEKGKKSAKKTKKKKNAKKKKKDRDETKGKKKKKESKKKKEQKAAAKKKSARKKK